MKRSIIFLMVLVLLITPIKAGSTMEGYNVVSELSKENIVLHAKKSNGFYQDFKIHFKGQIYSRPFWTNVTNPTYAPKIYYEDINEDEKRELIIILTKGYSTGVLDQEIYVYQYTNGLIEVLVDNPLVIINKNVITKLTAKKAEIRVGDKIYIVDVTPFEIQPKNVFEDIGFGSIIKYEVKSNHLIAKIPGQISPAGFIGQIVIIYEYRDKMYQANSFEFQQVDL